VTHIQLRLDPKEKKMTKIGIIGTGHIGGALTRLFTRAGHQVSIANTRGPASLKDLANETGARATSIGEVVPGNDMIVIAIPMRSVADLPPTLFDDAAADLVVVDTSNYYPQQRDGRIDAVEAGMTESAWVESQIGRPVIKVFNSIIAENLLNKNAPGERTRIALAVAGDDSRSKSAVMKLVGEIGFDPVDAGTIAESWRQQPGSPGYLKDYDAAGVRQALTEAKPVRTPEWRAQAAASN
jgi:predicted dinucleotide-binding enzyme